MPSIFSQYAEILSANNDVDVFKHHPQLALMKDVLKRQSNHSLALKSTYPEPLKRALMQSLSVHFPEHQVIYFDMVQFSFCPDELIQLKNDCQQFLEDILSQKKKIIFVINQWDTIDKHNPLMLYFTQWLVSLSFQTSCRLIVWTSRKLTKTFQDIFYLLPLERLQEDEVIELLKIFKKEIEVAYDVIISDHLITHAFSIAQFYLPQTESFTKTLSLLESSAARTEAKEPVTENTLSQVVSDWTGVPSVHLFNNKFKSNKFLSALQKTVHGQEAACLSIVSLLQRACFKLGDQRQPLASFLWAGPHRSGKAAAAISIAEYLYGSRHACIRIQIKNQWTALDEKNLLEQVYQTPYAIVLLENIDRASPELLVFFQHILTHGFATDAKENRYDFRHTIFIMTTTVSADHIVNVMQKHAARQASSLDLIQLVLNQPNLSTIAHPDLFEEIVPVLEKHFPADFLQQCHIIPFLPLDEPAFKKLLDIKLLALKKKLLAHFEIALSYSDEVSAFLLRLILNTATVDKILEQHVYNRIAQEIMIHIDENNWPKKLCLQLNDSGQVLRCIVEEGKRVNQEEHSPL